MTTALITGATGFIGQYLLHDLLDAGWQCRVLTRSAWPDLAQSGVEVVRGDITQPVSLTGVADDVDVVFHLAGAGHVAAVSSKAYAEFRAINVEGVKNLIAVCRGVSLR